MVPTESPGRGRLKPGLPPRKRLAFLVNYLAIIATAELLLVFASLSNDTLLAVLGLLVDMALVVILPVQASFLAAKDEPLAGFLGAMTLAPLLRVVSLSTPFYPFTTIEWLAIVSVPLLLAVAGVMRALRLRASDVFLGPGRRRYIAVNVTLVAMGFLIGYLEYRVLRPEAWIVARDAGHLAAAIPVVFLSTGLIEELIFRGVLLRTGMRLLGRPGALVYVSILFAILHIGFMSWPDLLLVFFTGLLFGVVVLFTESLWGAIGAHTFADVLLYLILPFGL